MKGTKVEVEASFDSVEHHRWLNNVVQFADQYWENSHHEYNGAVPCGTLEDFGMWLQHEMNDLNERALEDETGEEAEFLSSLTFEYQPEGVGSSRHMYVVTRESDLEFLYASTAELAEIYTSQSYDDYDEQEAANLAEWFAKVERIVHQEGGANQ
jgi:hypothetical protein